MNPTHGPAPRNELPRRRLLRNAMASVPLSAGVATVSYTHLTLPTNREV